ncbi:urease accessory protein UreF [Dysgonomonas sp. ZJ709]|uniref:urease accessory protein UreF n=1 Tax=Dysgonomonas sp. ZJ709 TaxID=2709797 RepID=UPI0013ED8842|nr:urease accessory protein UreF [Dysgonomonas sp. ZJ709]
MNAYIGKLLHLCDPTLPIGGYSHSNGLESYVQHKIVKDDATTESFVHNMITNNVLYNDASFVKLAYETAMSNDIAALIALDQECAALKAPVEIKQASRKLGVRLFKIFDRQVTSPIIEKYQEAINSQEAEGHYSVTFGLYAALFGIPISEAIYAFFYNSAVGMVTNAVKLVPLSQLSGQDILYRMQDVIQSVVPKVLSLDRSLVGFCNIGFDIRCMEHEKLYSRLYMS